MDVKVRCYPNKGSTFEVGFTTTEAASEFVEQAKRRMDLYLIVTQPSGAATDSGSLI